MTANRQATNPQAANPPGPSIRPAWQEARVYAHRAAAALPAVTVPLGSAAGRTLAADLAALCDVPHYASSAMDGWAVSGDGPWMLAPTRAGSDPSLVPLSPGEARIIVTGGLVPPGADRIVPTERATLDTNKLSEAAAPPANPEAAAPPANPNPNLNPAPNPAPNRPRTHIRPTGEEARRGDIVLRRGLVLNPAHLAVAAACGHDDLPVRGRARVALVLTGNEVQVAGIPRPGFVRDSFGVTLPSLVGSLGGDVVRVSRSRDSRAELVAELRRSDGLEPGVDLIVTTGSTGGSGADHLHDALREIGAELIVDRVAMRPGGPSLLARLPSGCLLLGLPGNPLAAMVALVVLGHPLLAGFAAAPLPPVSQVVTRDAVEGRPGAALFSPFRLVDGRAVLNDFTGSAMMRGLADADGLLVCPAEGAPAGSSLDALPVPWRPLPPSSSGHFGP
ncbi:hypothetical protein B7R54_14065 [Subtercola boreus]|uniref:Molybdopterin molybdenumtransferase n=1 Tax=Subtercola boreus TaxID=120213 RepID=A0A3E0VMT6_9MICO|nr:molybdopterin molybdotransferase MoeA [Subtercola boreus]RFA10207.1 hypothetical protein B7R54_14065 [Subtercola boreus]TQL52621.1 molybdopterin molybdotransferase [Subtercola boreus]